MLLRAAAIARDLRKAVSASVETASSPEPLPGWLYQRVASTAVSKNPVVVPMKEVDLVYYVPVTLRSELVVVLLAMESHCVAVVLHPQQQPLQRQPDLNHDA